MADERLPTYTPPPVKGADNWSDKEAYRRLDDKLNSGSEDAMSRSREGTAVK